MYLNEAYIRFAIDNLNADGDFKPLLKAYVEKSAMLPDELDEDLVNFLAKMENVLDILSESGRIVSALQVLIENGY